MLHHYGIEEVCCQQLKRVFKIGRQISGVGQFQAFIPNSTNLHEPSVKKKTVKELPLERQFKTLQKKKWQTTQAADKFECLIKLFGVFLKNFLSFILQMRVRDNSMTVK